jgi:hypothetical protein
MHPVYRWNQENLNKEAEIHSLRACRKEMMACQEATKANIEKMEPTDCVTAIFEQMIAIMKANRENLEAMDLKANPGEMESQLVY